MSRFDDVPEWIRPGKLRWVWGLWEPLAHYRRQGGDPSPTGIWNPRWAAQYYDRMRSEEIVAKLADMGVNLTTAAFFKGFGLEAEASEMERTRAFAVLCHRYGIRVLGYCQLTTIIYETMLREVPDLERWACVGADGRPLIYGSSYWRWYGCATCDDHIAYLEQVIDRALRDAGLDGVYWDGGPYECHCARCQEHFRAWLADKYRNHARQELEELFGLPYLDFVRIPTGTSPRDPLYRELLAFRREMQHRRLVRLHRHARSVDPEAAFVHYAGPTALERPDGYLPDIIVDENWDLPHVHGEAGIVNRIRRIKLHEAPGRLVLSTSWLRDPERGGERRAETPGEAALDLAEHGAFGGHVIAATWALRPGTPPDGAHFERPDLYPVLKRYMEHYRDNERLYDVSRSLANVGLYSSFESLTYDGKKAYIGQVGVEQALIWNHIPHVMVLSARREAMHGLDALVLANQTCLSDAEVEEIERFVRTGKGLVLAGEVGTRDEHCRLRLRPAFEHLRGEERVVFLPAALEGVRPLGNERKAELRYVPHLPPRHREIAEGVRRAAVRLPLELEAPATVAADLFETAWGGVVLHLVNYDNAHPVRDVRARLFPPTAGSGAPGAPWQATWYSPDLPDRTPRAVPVRTEATAADGGVEVVVPELHTYSCVLLHRGEVPESGT